MTSPSHPTFCPECGKPVPEESQHQVCPSCLMAQALASRTIVPGGETKDSFPPPSPEEIADKFPQFEITECLGRGGMGVVYKARQKSLDRWVAIKILPPERVGEEKFADRFAREAQTLAKLNHPNIVTVYDYGEADGLFYIVMEYVDGVNLRDLLRDGKLEAKQALAIVPPVCEALQYAHDKGIVHRDIKPENLLLDRDGRIKIADFGIASLIGDGGENIGTPPYMAPEQAAHASGIDHRADIYALGAVLYEMLTGQRPGKDLATPLKKVQLDVRIDEMVLRALEKSPELRYQTADDFRTVVETMAKPAVISPEPPPLPEKRKKRRKKVIFRLADGSPSRTALLMIALVCTLGGALIMFVGEPVWDFLTSDHLRLIPIEADVSMQSPSAGFSSIFSGVLGIGAVFAIALFIFALVMIGKSNGSGTSKGLAAGCLVLVFGFILFVMGAVGFFIRAKSDWAASPGFPVNGFPTGFTHPPVATHYQWNAPLVPTGLLLFIVLPLVILFGVLLLLRFRQKGKSTVQASSKKSSGWMMVLSVMIGLLLAVILFRFRANNRFLPASSLSPAYQAPVIGRVEFEFSHPDSMGVGLTTYSYDVKQGGDSQWIPSSGSLIQLQEKQSITFKSRVDASGGGSPRAIVNTARNTAEWEKSEDTKEMILERSKPTSEMVFENGLRVSIRWRPVNH